MVADVFEPFWVEYDTLKPPERRELAITVSNGITEFDDYLRAKWVGGSRQLNNRAWYSQIAETTVLDSPRLHGTCQRCAADLPTRG